jgi:hypothetical protein
MRYIRKFSGHATYTHHTHVHTQTHTPHTHIHTPHTYTHRHTTHTHTPHTQCTKLIFALSKSAKLHWGLKHAALKTIYTGGILALLLYGAPVWRQVTDNASYKSKLVRVQRLINIKISKAYRTVSNDVLCILTGLTPSP